ncbi:MAG: hypothetical protein MJZ16_08375 [Bacteroidales bacterium]|nr:hypothetical protein [Bacteroidales bacterium]
MIDTVDNRIIDFAKGKEKFKSSELLNVLNANGEKEVSKATCYWRLRELVNRGVLSKVGYGEYSSATKSRYSIQATERMSELHDGLRKGFPFVEFCFYSGNWMAPFLHHISTNNITYVEVERDACEAVFHYLQEQGHKAFLHPDRLTMERYVNLAEEAIIVKPLISGAPVIKDNEISVSSLEKILVDICADEDFFYLQGMETFYIFRNADEQYAINRSRLLRYAARRGKNVKSTIERYLKEVEG